MFNVEKFQQGWREGEETWNLTEITARSGREGEIGVPRGSGIQGLSVLMAVCFSPGITKILKNLSEFRIEDGDSTARPASLSARALLKDEQSRVESRQPKQSFVREFF